LITGLLIYQNRTTGGDLIAQTTAINEGLSSARREAASSASPNWKAITEQYQSAVVQIEVGWHIVDTASKGTLYHRMVRNRDRNGKPLIPIKREYLPGFVKLIVGSQSFIEPFTEPNLKSEQGENASDNIPIGGKHQGSGFVADPNGFILTNKHVAATWEMKYQWPDIKEYQAGGILLVYQKNPVTEKLEQAGGPMYLRPEEFPTDWIPANSRLRGGKLFSGKNVDGEFDYLEVVFAGDRLRRRARLILPSDRHDVALIKVDVTQPLNHVQMRLVERDGEVKKQEPVLVMGYPSVTPEGIQVTASAQGFGNNSSAASVPDPTATSGAIQNLPRDKVSSEQTIFSEIGDAYQLDINATGSGNSGGPVFDDKGRVIGIFYAGRASGGAVVSFALPISYGLDLMGPKTATSK
jgi:S1-C subfamily serine protease